MRSHGTSETAAALDESPASKVVTSSIPLPDFITEPKLVLVSNDCSQLRHLTYIRCSEEVSLAAQQARLPMGKHTARMILA